MFFSSLGINWSMSIEFISSCHMRGLRRNVMAIWSSILADTWGRSGMKEIREFLWVFKGKKMPGRMGGVQRTVKNVWVYNIDPARNLMWVPGAEGNFVFIKDSVYKKPDILTLPFPTLPKKMKM
ncbi:hypothetical protein H5410_003695 [Solanum commersonii]|uniref:Uncharacterized protein n=1 Tax=Solanum commersonii TaxID=4109 RepID=A0A9J6B5U0_SOLCO|nr:hypothetical protein H5410_003695 [Solanum commersonii]